MELERILTEIGLSQKESATYIALLQLGSSTIKPISDRAGIKRTSIYNFIDRLIDLGLVSQATIRGRLHYQAESPKRLIELQQSRLARLEESIPQFMGLFNSLGAKPRISYLQGPSQIKQIVEQEPKCKKEALYIWPGQNVIDVIGGVSTLAAIDKERIANDVWLRVVRFREKEVTFSTSKHGQKFKRELRFAPPSFKTDMGVGVFDTGKVGFISSQKEGFGILIESRELMLLMRSFFELLWDRSIPAREGEG